MFHSRITLVFWLLFSLPAFAQQPTQTIKGTVLDIASNRPVAFANISIQAVHAFATADSLGSFSIPNIPVGCYSLAITAVAYQAFVMNEILVTSAKETFLNIFLEEKTTNLAEVVIQPKLSKEMPLNATASISAKMLSVEEARRYAGGFDDPARLVSAFAGVSSNIGNNGIIVRGNSPKSLQWKLEGIEISNPNHFADNASFGGGVLSALSSQCLANSDFFTGAFPAEYSNALSGVFDISMRKGSNTQREHTFQIGLTGIDFASEGPFRKNGKASYLFNYRYSTLALMRPLLPENGGNGVKYQDLSFKLNFPTKAAGTFSVWGIGLIDYTGVKAKADTLEWLTPNDRQTQDIGMNMGALGLSHKYFINDKSYIKTIVAATTNGIDFSIKTLQKNGELDPESNVKNNSLNLVFSSLINTKFSAKHTNKTGIVITNMAYHLELNKAVLKDYRSIVNENGSSILATAYSNSTFKFSDMLTLNLGLNAQLFTLNQHYTIEPRAGIKYQFQSNQSFSFAYGLHSRLDRLNYYFAKNAKYGNEAINQKLDFTKAHHWVIGYDLNITENLHLKTEAYFQYLFNVPVIKDSSFSFINLINDWFVNEKLQNTGNGRNYGIDISLDKYLTNGFYYSFTASVFNSEYKAGDQIWRNTRYNRNYVFNFLMGKEWTLGNSKQKTFGINTRFSYQGGDRYSPIDAVASNKIQDVVFNENKAFSSQLTPSFTAHLTLLYRVNKAKTTRELALKILNAGMYHEFYDFRYNYPSQSVQEHREAIIIPNLSYKIEF